MASLPDRPKALTEEMQKAILNALASGMYFGPACELAGIRPSSVKYWIKLVERGVEHAQVYADFCAQIKKAVAASEWNALDAVANGTHNWQSRAWFLERRFPDRWAKNEKIEHSATDGKTVIVVSRTVAKQNKEEPEE